MLLKRGFVLYIMSYLTLPVLLYGSETWTIKASDAGRIIVAEMKYMRRTAGYTWTDYKTNAQIAKELKITPILDKLLEYKRSCIQHVNRMPRNRLPRVMKYYSPTGRRNHGRPLKRLLDTWDRNGSTSGPTPWKIHDDDDDDDDNVTLLWERIFLDNFSLKPLEGTAIHEYQENPSDNKNYQSP